MKGNNKMTAVKKRNPKTGSVKSLAKLKMSIDVNMCDLFIAYSLSKYPSNLHLANLRNLLQSLDLESYVFNYDIYNRLVLTLQILKARLDDELKSLILIKQQVEEDPTMIDLVKTVKWDDSILSVGDTTKISKYVDDKMKYIFYEKYMPRIVELWQTIESSGMDSRTDELRELGDIMTKIVSNMQTTTAATRLLRRFSFAAPNMDDVLYGIMAKAQQPAAILQTGIVWLNSMLGPGFRSGKLYTFLGMSGKFKSGTLLNIADQIRTFNPQLEDVVNGKRNTILFVTMENDIEETIERVFSMYAPGKSFVDSTFEEVVSAIRENGKFVYSDTKGIDIDIRFYYNLEIATSDLYSLIDECERSGAHVVTLILDYIKRINSTNDCGGDEVVRCSHVAKELKSIAEYFAIPVITAQQINRAGNQVVDAAMREGKQDLIRFLGNSDIGSAWSVIEESDWVCIVNLERQLSSNMLFLTFKRTKQRASSGAAITDYFNHPFVADTMRLQTDVDKKTILSIKSLSSDIASVDQEAVEKSAQVRPRIVMKSNATPTDIANMIQNFDPDNSTSVPTITAKKCG